MELTHQDNYYHNSSNYCQITLILITVLLQYFNCFFDVINQYTRGLGLRTTQ